MKTLLLDLLFLAEVSWCTLFTLGKTVREGLLYVGGFLTASYVATQMTPWMTKTFAESTGEVVTWLSDTVITKAQSVSLAIDSIPPETAVAGGVSHSEWVAMHVFQSLLGITITLAIFVLFVVVGHLTEVIWDVPQFVQTKKKAVRWGAAFICGLFLTVQTMIVIANLSWFSWFHSFASAASESIFLQSASFLSRQWQLHHFISLHA